MLLGVVPACLAMLVALPAAYAFGRLKFFGRGGILALIVFSGFLPIVASIIPLFELFKDLHIIGTWWALFLVYTGFLLGFTTWILSLFVARIPIEVEEAARPSIVSELEHALLRFVIVPLAPTGDRQPVYRRFLSLVEPVPPQADYLSVPARRRRRWCFGISHGLPKPRNCTLWLGGRKPPSG